MMHKLCYRSNLLQLSIKPRIQFERSQFNCLSIFPQHHILKRGFGTKRIVLEDLGSVPPGSVQHARTSLVVNKTEESEKIGILVQNLKYFIDKSEFERAEQYFKQITTEEGILYFDKYFK
jgi:hypothetical protein